MDFFGHQDVARRKTRQLIWLFAAAVLGIVVAVYVPLRLYLAKHPHWMPADAGFFEPVLAGRVALFTLGIIAIGSIFKTLALRRGGRVIATTLGGRELSPNSSEPAERRLLNVVEEMALAAGVPVPIVFLLDKETGINAFAAGFSTAEAVIGVTRGAVDQLDRDELQGVIAHELSHIVNGDMRLNLRLVGVVHGILVIALLGYEVLRLGGHSRKGGGIFFVAGGVLLAIGGLGVFFARLIKAALSRQREFLADASAVQFTRHPQGLADALEKVAGSGSKIADSHAEEASHFFFANGLGTSFLAMLSTHPPLGDRIRRLDPSNDRVQTMKIGPQPSLFGSVIDELGNLQAPSEPRLAPIQVDADRARALAGKGKSTAPAQAAAAMVAAVGQLEERHVAYAKDLIARLRPELVAAVREPLAAQAVVLGLLLDRDPALRRRQSEALKDAPQGLLFEIPRLQPLVLECPVEARLPLLDLAMPALARLSPAQYATFAQLVDHLVEADQNLALFELALQRALLRNLGRRFDPAAAAARPQIFALGKLDKEISTLLSALAHSGATAAGEGAAHAFEIGAAQLRSVEKLPLALLPEQYCGLAQVDSALRRLDLLTPRMKKPLLAACAATVAADRRVELAEAELLRAIADTLGCPVPPFLPGQQAA